ncbi:NAD(P)-dependent alcohol dehydrogenase [Streptomyces sp. NPDC046805]|uniref:NAD(P)-dependent alcohol dehydrogenase n=1 Tax=Streptomyces sp. NPDC046805 TaxID=3155134 RepID=UPI0033F491E0
MLITAALSMEVDPKGKFVLEELELEEPRANEIVVKTVATGICGSDLHGRGVPFPRPIVFGHEGAGVVAAVGSAVTKLQVGDHVLLNYLACGKCRVCVSGKPKLCPSNSLLNHSGGRADGTTGLSRNGEVVYGQFFGQSSFATHCIANEQQATKLDPAFDLTLAPALACGVQTGAGAVLNGLKPSPGSSLLTTGTGAVGMAAVMMARILGCTTIIAVDVSAERLALAQEIGATHVINSRETDDLAAAVRQIVPDGVDYAVEASGRIDVAESAIQSVTKGGSVALLGIDPSGAKFSVSLQQMALSGISISGFPGGLAVPDDMVPRLIELHARGQFPVDKLVARFPFEQINEAAEAASSGRAIKPVLVF